MLSRFGIGVTCGLVAFPLLHSTGVLPWEGGDAVAIASSPPSKVVEEEARKAVCVLGPHGSGSTVSGTVTFTQASPADSTHIVAELSGLEPGKHGFHVHAKGDLSGGCATTGGHWNPFGFDHGGPGSKLVERHPGDLGNVSAGEDGKATLVLDDDGVSLYGDMSVVGRAIVVHKGEDDLGTGGHADSKKTGHAGARLASGVIGIA